MNHLIDMKAMNKLFQDVIMYSNKDNALLIVGKLGENLTGIFSISTVGEWFRKNFSN